MNRVEIGKCLNQPDSKFPAPGLYVQHGFIPEVMWPLNHKVQEFKRLYKTLGLPNHFYSIEVHDFKCIIPYTELILRNKFVKKIP